MANGSPAAAPPNQSTGRGAVILKTRDPGLLWLAVTGADEEVHLYRVADPPVKLAVLRAPQGGAIGGICVNTLGTLSCAAPKGEVQLWPLRVIRQELDQLGLRME